ncbi:1197_t:CDS:2 [Entrophospora sp. SA101]|nr:1197_t:CDS:2 [Entrophospora sp. SA101]
MAIAKTFIALNVLRMFSIVSLLLVIATCILVNVKGFRDLGRSNTIFQFMNRCVFAIGSIILILTEFGWPRRIFYWFPMLDETKSWTFFGFVQIVIGSLILGYDSGINSESFLGQGLFVFISVPGWFIFIIGVIYLLLGCFGGVELRQKRRLGAKDGMALRTIVVISVWNSVGEMVKYKKSAK